MQPKTLIWISLALTVFVITAIAGVIFTVHNTTQADAAGLNTNVATTVATPDMTASTQEAQLVQVMNQREQAYQDTISQANARLDQAQKEIQSLQEQLQALQPNNDLSTSRGTTSCFPGYPAGCRTDCRPIPGAQRPLQR